MKIIGFAVPKEKHKGITLNTADLRRRINNQMGSLYKANQTYSKTEYIQGYHETLLSEISRIERIALQFGYSRDK